MSLSNRLLFIAMGALISYFGVLAGSAFRPMLQDFMPFSWIPLALAGIGGVIVWGYAFDQIYDGTNEDIVVPGSIALACGCFLFGVIAQPTNGTSWISSAWINAWTVLPLIAAVPFIVAIKDVCLDIVFGIIEYRRGRKAQKLASEKVLPFKRRDQ